MHSLGRTAWCKSNEPSKRGPSSSFPGPSVLVTNSNWIVTRSRNQNPSRGKKISTPNNVSMFPHLEQTKQESGKPSKHTVDEWAKKRRVWHTVSHNLSPWRKNNGLPPCCAGVENHPVLEREDNGDRGKPCRPITHALIMHNRDVARPKEMVGKREPKWHVGYLCDCWRLLHILSDYVVGIFFLEFFMRYPHMAMCMHCIPT